MIPNAPLHLSLFHEFLKVGKEVTKTSVWKKQLLLPKGNGHSSHQPEAGSSLLFPSLKQRAAEHGCLSVLLPAYAAGGEGINNEPLRGDRERCPSLEIEPLELSELLFSPFPLQPLSNDATAQFLEGEAFGEVLVCQVWSPI